MFSHQTALVSTFKQTSYFKTKGLASTGILIDVNISQRLGQTFTSCLINNPADKYLEHSAILSLVGAKLERGASPPLPRWTTVLKEQRMQKKPLSKQDGHTVWELDLSRIAYARDLPTF